MRRRPSHHPLSEDPSDFEPIEFSEDEDREPEDPPEMTDEDYGKLDDENEARAERFFHGD